jgi:hypothetical protein
MTYVHVSAIAVCMVLAGFIVWGMHILEKREDRLRKKRFNEFMEKNTESIMIMRCCPRCFRAFYGPDRPTPITCPMCEKGK